MAYTKPTLQEIYDRIKSDMEARVTDDVKIPSVSLLGIIAAVMAGAAYLIYGFLQWISEQMFPDTADESGLTRWGNIYGIGQQAATYASGDVAFTGTAATVVAAGTQVQNDNGIVFETDAAFTIGTTVSVGADALTPGTDGNEDTLTLVSPLSGVNSSVTAVTGFDDAEDEETLESWLTRILQRIQNPPSSGTIGDYERWALSQSGVVYAWGYGADDWNGAGTVGVAISGTNFVALSSGTILDVQDYIDGVKPAPANVTVYSPTPVVIDFDISITPNTSTYQDAIEAAIQELFEADAEPGGTMYISRINSAVGSSGVSDYIVNDIVIATVPSGAANFTVTMAQVAQLGSISWSAVP